MRFTKATRWFWAALTLAAAASSFTAACGARSTLEESSVPAGSNGGSGVGGSGHGGSAPDASSGHGGSGHGGSGHGGSAPDAGSAAPPDAGPPPSSIGCADGTREAFRDEMKYPDIAGCSGGFEVAGILPAAPPRCGRHGGNDGPNPKGAGCGAGDLCAAGFHICRGAAEVAARSPDGCDGVADAERGSFFATGQSGPGCNFCATGTDPTCFNESCTGGCAQTDQTTNDIFGCAELGQTPDMASCAPLNATSGNLCGNLSGGWQCPDVPGGDERESRLVTKASPEGGGVLCCRD